MPIAQLIGVLMKSNLLNLIVLIMVTVSQFGLAHARGPGGSSGGSGPEVEFIQISKHIAQILELIPERFPLVPVEQMWRVYSINTKDDSESYKVKVLPQLMKDGEEKDALNYPGQDLIELSSSRWDLMTKERKYIVVLHEILGVMKVKDDGYTISEEIGKVLRDHPKLVDLALERPLFPDYKKTTFWQKLADRVQLGMISKPARFKVLKLEECNEVDVHKIEDACSYLVEVLDSRSEFYKLVNTNNNTYSTSKVLLYTKQGFNHKKGDILSGWAYRVEPNLSAERGGSLIFATFDQAKAQARSFCENTADKLCSVNLGEKTESCKTTAVGLCLGK